jgi:hypothetical protein
LQLDPTDPDLLYHAGLNAALTHSEREAKQFWQSYLTASESLSSESKRRSEVRNLIPELMPSQKPPAGNPNWFSNYNNAPGLMYDPVSLATNSHPDDIKASKKQTTTFEWRGNTLNSVRTTTAGPGEPPASVYFEYFPGGKGVRRVSSEPFEEKTDPGAPKLTPEGTVGPGKGAYPALSSDPSVNPYMVEKLTGKRVGTIVAGNPYFQPFVWSGVHVFLAEYDAEGRVKSAKSIRSRDGGQVFEFHWQGNKLMSIVEASGGGYRREMKYDGDRIVGETVQFRGKSTKITYKYSGDRLMEADCDDDASLDGRSRRVTFGR